MFQRLQPPEDVVWLRIFSKNAAKPKEIEVLVGRTSYFTILFARTVYVFFEGGAFWGPLGLPWVVSAASWDPPGALRGPSGRLLARGGPKKAQKVLYCRAFREQMLPKPRFG